MGGREGGLCYSVVRAIEVVCNIDVYHTASRNTTTNSFSAYFSFVSPFCSLIWRGYRRPLQYADLWSLNPDDRSSYIRPHFEKAWKKELKRAK